LLGLETASIGFVAADMPNAHRLAAGIMAMIAEEERHGITRRTEDALAAAKRRGVKLAGYRAASKLTAKALKAGQEAHARIAAERAVPCDEIAPLLGIELRRNRGRTHQLI
jgi:DNA invertase Pin-like site-specific DNA recombinase